MIEYNQKQQIDIDEGTLAWVDDDTSLMWEVKSKENINALYTWHKRYEAAARAQNSKWLESDVIDCHSYVERMNRERYAGFDDWRLPTKEELLSLVVEDQEHIKIKIPLKGNSCPAYWSGSPTLAVNLFKFTTDWKETAHIEGICIVDYKKARAFGYKPEFTLWLRCVRSNWVLSS
jgi:hypothetical protein